MDAALKVVVDIVNKDAIKKLQKDVEDETRAVQDLNKQFIQGTINAQQFGTASIAAGDKIVRANTAIKSLEGSSASGGRALGQLAYAIDDVQYGFNAIVNNIPQIVMGLGGSFGLAGAVGIAAVAINQLINHWGALTDIAQSQWSGDSVGQLRALREHAEDAAKAFEKLAKVPTKAQGAQVEGVASAVTEAGTEGVAAALAVRLAQDPAVRKKVTSGMNFVRRFALGRMGIDPGGIERDIGDEARDQANKMVGAAMEPGQKGEVARQQLEQKLRGMGENGLADQIAQARDAAKNAQAAKDFAGERGGEHAMEEARKKALDDIKKQVLLKKEIDDKAKAETHRQNLQALEDQRSVLLGEHHQQDLLFERMRARMGHGSQTLDGPKAVSDYYQKASLDSPIVALAKAQKDLQEKQLKELQEVNKKLEKERRVRPS